MASLATLLMMVSFIAGIFFFLATKGQGGGTKENPPDEHPIGQEVGNTGGTVDPKTGLHGGLGGDNAPMEK